MYDVDSWDLPHLFHRNWFYSSHIFAQEPVVRPQRFPQKTKVLRIISQSQMSRNSVWVSILVPRGNNFNCKEGEKASWINFFIQAIAILYFSGMNYLRRVSWNVSKEC